MAPTICSGKKRQTRTIATSNIRRHGQGAHQLNQAFSNFVNFVAKGSSRVPTAVRIQTHNQIERNLNTTDNYHSANIEADLIYNYLIKTSATSTSSHRLERCSFLTDNAVTSSTHSDTENSLDLRLANEILDIDTTSVNNTNTKISSSPLSLETNSLLSHKKKTSSPVSQRQEILLNRYSPIMQAEKLTGHTENCSEHEEANLYEKKGIENKLHSIKSTSELHSSNKGKNFSSYNDFDSEEDEWESERELNSGMSAVSSDTDMELSDSDSMTSLDTEKSAKLKRANHPPLSDKHFAKHLENSSSNNHYTKTKNNKRNTDGLLSIAVKTIKLFKRNEMLQQRLTQLQLETTEFIQSVLANPENRHFRENTKQKVFVRNRT